jgi:integrase
MAYYRRRGNRWQLRWETPDGRETSQSFATEAEAKAAKKRVDATMTLTGAPPITARPGVPTVAEWWDRWEPGQRWRPSTRATHDSHWRTSIRPAFGRMPIDAVTVDQLERWHRTLERRLAPGTVAANHRTFALALAGAERAGLLDRNPARLVRPLSRRPVATPEMLTDEALAELDRALADTEPRLRTFARVCALAGLRRGEAAGLTWDRVDLEHQRLTVDRQLDFTATRAAHTPIWSPTKTGEARQVPIPAPLAADLRAHRSEYGIGAGQLVFTDRRNHPWNSTRLSAVWRDARDCLANTATPLPASARGWHSLRHGYASRLLTAGVPVAEVAAVLGHADASTTLRTYAHMLDEAEAHARVRRVFDS